MGSKQTPDKTARAAKKEPKGPPRPKAVRDYIRAIASLGGTARMARLSDDERRAIATKAGKAGGPARAKALTPARRREIARKAARTRWSKKEK